LKILEIGKKNIRFFQIWKIFKKYKKSIKLLIPIWIKNKNGQYRHAYYAIPDNIFAIFFLKYKVPQNF
jgi:hypothetical protein